MGGGGGVWTGERGVCRQNIWYHVAAFVFLFDMEHDHGLKKMKVTF